MSEKFGVDSLLVEEMHVSFYISMCFPPSTEPLVRSRSILSAVVIEMLDRMLRSSCGLHESPPA